MRGRTNITQRAVPYVNGQVVQEIAGEQIDVGDFVEYRKTITNRSIGGTYVGSGFQVNQFLYDEDEEIYLFSDFTKVSLVNIKNGFTVLSSVAGFNCYLLSDKKVVVISDGVVTLYSVDSNYNFVEVDSFSFTDTSYGYQRICQLSSGVVVFWKYNAFSFYDVSNDEFDLLGSYNSTDLVDYEKSSYMFAGKNDHFGFVKLPLSGSGSSQSRFSKVYYYKYNSNNTLTLVKEISNRFSSYNYYSPFISLSNLNNDDIVFYIKDSERYGTSSNFSFAIAQVSNDDISELEDKNLVPIFKDYFYPSTGLLNLSSSVVVLDDSHYLLVYFSMTGFEENVQGSPATGCKACFQLVEYSKEAGSLVESNIIAYDCPSEFLPKKENAIAGNADPDRHPFGAGSGFMNNKGQIFYVWNVEGLGWVVTYFEYKDGVLRMGEQTQYIQKYTGNGAIGFAKSSGSAGDVVSIYVPNTSV